MATKGVGSSYKIEKVINKMTKDNLVNFQNMVLGVHAELRTETPRDTGWAANNWIASKGKPVLNTVGTPQAVNSSPQGIVDVLTYSVEEAKKGVPLFVTNNVPYIRRLNNGWSKKKPAGFIERAIQKAEKGGFTSGKGTKSKRGGSVK